MMKCPAPRGPVSALVISWLVGKRSPSSASAVAIIDALDPHLDVIADDDCQIALWALYELHYGGFSDADERWEWAPEAIAVRNALDRRFECSLREATAPWVAKVVEGEGPLEDLLFALTQADSPALTPYLHHRADREQMLEFLRHRSIYHLKEADSHTWAIPRLTGSPKVAMVEIQYDEYGAGRPARQHSAMFADTLEACGLSSTYGAYIDEVPAEVLAVNNAMSLFGLHRRLRAAVAGHLAAFEATSSLPARRVALGLRRLGFPAVAAAYFDEHIEADAVHEQLAVRTICGGLAEAEPEQLETIAFGAATCLYLDNRAAALLLDQWAREARATPVPTPAIAG